MNEKQKIVFICLALVYLASGTMFLSFAPHNLEGLVMMYTVFGIPAFMFYKYFALQKKPLVENKIRKSDQKIKPSKDPIFEDAVRLVSRYEKASASLLQRALSIGFARAARLLGQMEEARIIGSVDNDGLHEVFIGKSKKKKKEEKLKN